MSYIDNIEIEFHYRHVIIDLECIKYEIWHIPITHNFMDISKLNQTFSINKLFRKQIKTVFN